MERQPVGGAAAGRPQVGYVHAVDAMAYVGTFAAVLDVGVAAAQVGARQHGAAVRSKRTLGVGIEQIVKVDSTRGIA